ncbi:hypothetical protein U1Q18_039322 [Sarracenia purpurea var. burkii]
MQSKQIQNKPVQIENQKKKKKDLAVLLIVAKARSELTEILIVAKARSESIEIRIVVRLADDESLATSSSTEILIVAKARYVFDAGEGCFISEIQIGASFSKSLLTERSRFEIIDRNLRRRLVDLFSSI